MFFDLLTDDRGFDHCIEYCNFLETKTVKKLKNDRPACQKVPLTEPDIHRGGTLNASLESRARIFKLARSPGIDSKETIPPAYVAWRVGAITLFLLIS
jgi:hypothetical protein